jgi:chromosomal replication initiator protein
VDSTGAQKVCNIRERVAGRIGQNHFRTWFGEATRFNLNGDRLQVTVQNPLVSTWISSNFMAHLVEATREVIGKEPRVDVHVAADGAPQAPPAGGSADDGPSAPTHRAPPPARRPAQVNGILRGELDTFVVGPGNQMAYSAANCIVRKPGEAFRLLVLHGGSGLGKTHLIQGLCNAVRRQHTLLEWRYVSGEEFTNEFVYALKAGRVDSFRARFRKVDLLAIDDIHFLAGKKATQEEFLHTFNAIDACGKAIVLTSDRHPRAIATLSEPLISRLVSGMVVEIEPPDFVTRREILRRRAAAMRADLPDEVVDHLARRITRNVRELEGALYKLVALASLMKQTINLELAELTAADYADLAARQPEARDIVRTVAAHFSVTREAINSRGRDRTLSLARALAMYLIRKHTSLSFPEIGRLLGNKNHSTVLMAVRRVEQTLDRCGAVTWRTSAGLRELPLKSVLAELERELARGEHQPQ